MKDFICLLQCGGVRDETGGLKGEQRKSMPINCPD